MTERYMRIVYLVGHKCNRPRPTACSKWPLQQWSFKGNRVAYSRYYLYRPFRFTFGQWQRGITAQSRLQLSIVSVYIGPRYATLHSFIHKSRTRKFDSMDRHLLEAGTKPDIVWLWSHRRKRLGHVFETFKNKSLRCGVSDTVIRSILEPTCRYALLNIWYREMPKGRSNCIHVWLSTALIPLITMYLV